MNDIMGIASVMCKSCEEVSGGCKNTPCSNVLREARRIYDAGYRKQSEDTVEVVRCKDCVYFKQSVSPLCLNATAFICDFPYGLQKNVSEKDFCCHGEKLDSDATPDPAASREVEQLIYKLECLLCHATGGLLSKHTYDLKTMESVVTDYIEKSCDEARAEAKSEVDQLKKALEAKDAEYTQALQDKARECNMVIDKICLEHRAKLALLHSSHEQELAKAKREVAKIFEEIDGFIEKNIEEITKAYKGDRLNGKAVLCAKYLAFIDAKKYLAELKKKYTEGE